MKKSILVGCIFVAIIAGISIGIMVHVYNDNTLEQATLEEVKNANRLREMESNIIQTASSEVKTTPNTKMIFETLYSSCSHVETITEEIEDSDVNKNEEYFNNKYGADWKVTNFSEDTVELYQERDGICDKHYVLREKDGYIAVYSLDSSGNENLKEMTDIYVSYLPEEDISLLEKGINVIGDNELERTIADYE